MPIQLLAGVTFLMRVDDVIQIVKQMTYPARNYNLFFTTFQNIISKRIKNYVGIRGSCVGVQIAADTVDILPLTEKK